MLYACNCHTCEADFVLYSNTSSYHIHELKKNVIEKSTYFIILAVTQGDQDLLWTINGEISNVYRVTSDKKHLRETLYIILRILLLLYTLSLAVFRAHVTGKHGAGTPCASG